MLVQLKLGTSGFRKSLEKFTGIIVYVFNYYYLLIHSPLQVKVMGQLFGLIIKYQMRLVMILLRIWI